MKTDFDAAIELVLKHEGGYSNHSADPGGATNMGITQRTLAAYRGKIVTTEHVKVLTRDEAEAIYYADYWSPIRGEELPQGLDYAVFDFAVHSGPSRAVKTLQRLLGVAQDGIVGSQTLAAIDRAQIDTLIRAYCAARMDFLRGLSTFKTFGRGWSRRLAEVEQNALAIMNDRSIVTPSTAAPGKADQASVRASKIPEAVAGGMAAVGAVLSGAADQVEPYIGIHWVVQYVFLGLTFGGIGFGVWKAIQRARGRV